MTFPTSICRCQACIRLDKDPAVRNVIAEHHGEKLADVVAGEWLLYDYPRKPDAVPA